MVQTSWLRRLQMCGYRAPSSDILWVLKVQQLKKVAVTKYHFWFGICHLNCFNICKCKKNKQKTSLVLFYFLCTQAQFSGNVQIISNKPVLLAFLDNCEGYYPPWYILENKLQWVKLLLVIIIRCYPKLFLRHELYQFNFKIQCTDLLMQEESIV